MERLGTALEAQEKVWADTQRLITHIHSLSAATVASVNQGIALLRKLREETYEDLNQIQHEHMILLAVDWLTLQKSYQLGTEWFWNPRQTGDKTEPDLRGVLNGEAILSAEITTSKEPRGTIDTRIRTTLEKLSKMKGQRFYFVASDSMAARAPTKILKAGWIIEAVRLP